MAVEPNPNRQVSEQTPLSAAWRFRWLVLLLTILGGGLAFVVVGGSATAEFRATGSLIVTDPKTSTLFSTNDATRNAARYVEDQVAILGSDSVAQRASEILTLSAPPIHVEGTTIADEVGIDAESGNEILVRYTAGEEHAAVATVNAVIAAYEEVRGESAAKDSASAVDQLDLSIATIDAELTAIETDINTIRDSSVQGALNLQYEAALERMVQLQTQLPQATGEDLDSIRLELADIDQQLTRISRVSTLEASTPDLVRLYGEQAEAISRRSNLAEQRDRLLVDTELLSGGISLSSPARTAERVEISILNISVLGAILGGLAGFGLASLLAVRRRKFTERAEPGWVLETSMLAEIPVFGEESLRTELPVLDNPASASAEAFRFAATGLDLPGQGNAASDGESQQAHTYLITSPGPREGKTVVTANLALAAARKGRRVLVIDADFGHQHLSQLLRGEEEGPGITEVVEAGLDLDAGTYTLGPPGPLDILSRGRRPTNAPDFFSLPATHAFMAKIGKLYDMVFIDGPPMLHVAYASILAQHVDRIVVVAQHGGPVTRLEDLAQRLDLIGTPLAGYVYNGAPLRYEMTMTEGSLADVLGDQHFNHATPIDDDSTDGRSRR